MTTPDWGQAGGYLPVSPLLPSDPPKVGDFWLDARLHATPAGVAFTAHRDLTSENADQNAGGLPGQGQPAMVILLSEGAAADAAARDRLAGLVNAMHIDAVLARGGTARTSAGQAGSTAPRTTTRNPRTIGSSPPGSPWRTTAHRRQPRRRRGFWTRSSWPPSPRRGRPPDLTTSTTGSRRSGPDWPGSGPFPGPGASIVPAGGPSWSPGC
jgi:hypothetical protein